MRQACGCASDYSYRDQGTKYCDVKAFKACLVTYWKWYTGEKGHVTVRNTRCTVQEIAFFCMEVISWLASWSCAVSALDTRLEAQVKAGRICSLLHL